MPETNVSWEAACEVVGKRVYEGFTAMYGSLEPDKLKRKVLDAYHSLYQTNDVTVKGVLKLNCFQNVYAFLGTSSLEEARDVLKVKIEEYAEKDKAEIDAEPLISFEG